MSRLRSIRFIPTLLALSIRRRPYFTVEGMDHSPISALDLNPNELPRAVKINGRYVCPLSGGAKKSFTDVLTWLWTSKKSRLSLPSYKYHEREYIQPVEPNYELAVSRVENKITWVGHSTMLVTLNGVNILTDPIWSDFASPMQFMGPKRYMPPALDLDKLNVDVVLLSHTHYDHMDYNTLLRIGDKAMWIVPMGVKSLLNSMGITRVHEMDWWQHHVLDESSDVPGRLEIVFTPTKHWTSRNPFDRNTCLWGSFAVLSSSGKFFFGGDTAYHPFFTMIGDRYGPFDFAALPIGAYKPRWFMKDNHVNPAEAVQIHRDIKAKQTVAIHWGTFPLSDEDYIEPALELGRVRQLAGVPSDQFFTLAHGETWVAGQTPKLDFASVNDKMFDEYLESCERSIQETKKREMGKAKRNVSETSTEQKEL